MSSTNVKLETTMNLSTCNQQHAKFSHEHKTDHIISGTQKKLTLLFSVSGRSFDLVRSAIEELLK